LCHSVARLVGGGSLKSSNFFGRQHRISFFLSSFTLAAAAAAVCSLQPRLSSSACAWQGEESWAQQYDLLAPDSWLRPVCLQACEGLREDESTQLDAGAQRCHLHFLLVY